MCACLWKGLSVKKNKAAGKGDADLRPVHPGEVLRESFLLPLGLTSSALAIALLVPAPRINDIVRERRGITADTALRLARYFGNEPEFWMGLQDEYDLGVGRISLGDVLADIRPRPQA